jgi:hypothetical protein
MIARDDGIVHWRRALCNKFKMLAALGLDWALGWVWH